MQPWTAGQTNECPGLFESVCVTESELEEKAKKKRPRTAYISICERVSVGMCERASEFSDVSVGRRHVCLL